MRKLIGALFAGMFAVALAMPSGIAFAGEAAGTSAIGDDGTAVSSAGVMPLANTSDTSFTFTFNKSGATAACYEPRRKDNRTPAYVKVNVKTCDRCRAYIDQSSSGSWVNVTSQGKATIKKTGEFFIYVSSAFNTNSMVRFTGWADSTAGKVSGLWSPDSVGSYPSINGN